MKRYEISIGLEVHAELNTATKIFCSCENRFGGSANSRCCPICIGAPGALPNLNKKVVEYAVLMGHATKCRISSTLRMARKNYHYPDLPKAYQISQADMPLCTNGEVEYYLDGEYRSVRINRIHIEEDAGKLLHQDGENYSFVDLNRCGVPLIEIVTEPDLHSSEEAFSFLETIRNILLYVGISDCKMQEGSIRCDVNVSVRPEGESLLGTRCEMKNINTFRGVQRAIDFEASRQIAILENGGAISQETRRWDDEEGGSYLLRSKEDSRDYRYFNEPDIATMRLDLGWIECLRNSLPELPSEKMKRYISEYRLSAADAENLVRNVDRAKYFDACVSLNEKYARFVANWILGDVLKYLNEAEIEIGEYKVEPVRMIEMIEAVEKGIISVTAAKKILRIMVGDPESPVKIAEREGLLQNNNEDELLKIIKTVLSGSESAVRDYKNGKKNAFGFLVGQCMKQSRGKGNPQLINRLLLSELNEL